MKTLKFLHLQCFRMNQIGQPITDLFIGGKPLKLMSLLGSQKKVTLVKIKEIYLWTLTNIALLCKHHQSDVRLSIFNATFHQWKSPFARNLIRKVLESCFCLLTNKTLGYIRSTATILQGDKIEIRILRDVSVWLVSRKRTNRQSCPHCIV